MVKHPGRAPTDNISIKYLKCIEKQLKTNLMETKAGHTIKRKQYTIF